MSVLKRNSKGELVLLMQELLTKTGYPVATDGTFGKKTEEAVMNFQRENNLVVDGIVGPKTWTMLNHVASIAVKRMAKTFLSEADLQEAADTLGIELATIKAVNEVESSGRGFLANGEVKILFEGHVFWDRLKKKGKDPKKLKEGNEDILYPKQTYDYYGMDQHARLIKARKIDPSIALESASWGLFQIMGFNHKAAGYSSVQAFVTDMKKSEGRQLQAFVSFIKANKMDGHLKRKDWAKFASRYNGTGYKKNKYDTKLAAAYKKYSE